SIARYDSRLGGGPMRTASSASATCGASASASEKTATLEMPMARSVRKTRRAISPRLATRTFRKCAIGTPLLAAPMDIANGVARFPLDGPAQTLVRPLRSTRDDRTDHHGSPDARSHAEPGARPAERRRRCGLGRRHRAPLEPGREPLPPAAP